MTGDDTAYLLYLALFGAVVGGSYLLANRNRMGQMMQQAAIWFFIFIGFIVVYGLWGDIRNTVSPAQSISAQDGAMVVEVPRGRGGHYELTLGINGEQIPFLVDTGATHLVLTQADATRVGIDVDALRYFGQAQTANGTVGTADVRLDEIRIGDIIDRNVRAVVNEGQMSQSLLGMSYLQEFGRIEIADNTLRLIR